MQLPRQPARRLTAPAAGSRDGAQASASKQQRQASPAPSRPVPLPVCWRDVSTLRLTARPTKMQLESQTTTCAEMSYLPPSPEAARISRPHARNLTAQAIGPRLRQAPPSPNSPAEPARRNPLTYVAWTHSAHGLLAVECQPRDLDRAEEWRTSHILQHAEVKMNIQGSLLTSAFSSRGEPGPDHKHGTPMAVPSAPTTLSKTRARLRSRGLGARKLELLRGGVGLFALGPPPSGSHGSLQTSYSEEISNPPLLHTLAGSHGPRDCGLESPQNASLAASGTC